MEKHSELVSRLVESLTHGRWQQLAGPRGIGKRLIANDVEKRINNLPGSFIRAVYLSLVDIPDKTLNGVRQKILMLLGEPIGHDSVSGPDFPTILTHIIQNREDSTTLIVADFDIMSVEEANVLSAELTSAYNQLVALDLGAKLTVLITGGKRLSYLQHGHNAPFDGIQPIEVEELDYDIAATYPTRGRKVAETYITTLHSLTIGAPELFMGLLSFVPRSGDADRVSPKDECLDYNDRMSLAKALLKEIIGPQCQIRENLLWSWFSHIDDPEYLDIIQRLLNYERVQLADVELTRFNILYCGFLCPRGDDIQFRNEFVELFCRHYAHKRRLADHYWLFSNRFGDSAWSKGLTLYVELSDTERRRQLDEHVGPVFTSISDIIMVGGRRMMQKQSERAILATLDDMMQCLLCVRRFFVCERIAPNALFRVIYVPESGLTMNTGEEVSTLYSDLIKASLRGGIGWSHLWRYSYLAYPILNNKDRQVVVCIDNRDRRIEEGMNHWPLMIAIHTGNAMNALMQMESDRKKIMESVMVEKSILVSKSLVLQEDWIRTVIRHLKELSHDSTEHSSIQGAKQPLKLRMEQIGTECEELFRQSRVTRDVLSGRCLINESPVCRQHVSIRSLLRGLTNLAKSEFSDDLEESVYVDPDHVSHAITQLTYALRAFTLGGEVKVFACVVSREDNHIHVFVGCSEIDGASVQRVLARTPTTHVFSTSAFNTLSISEDVAGKLLKKCDGRLKEGTHNVAGFVGFTLILPRTAAL